MIDPTDYDWLDEQVYNEVADTIFYKKYPDEKLDGNISIFVDVDDTVDAIGTCTLTGEEIAGYLSEELYNYTEEYLRRLGAEYVYDLATPEDLESEETYRDYLFNLYNTVEQWWFDNYYEKFCEAYFEKNAEYRNPRDYY